MEGINRINTDDFGIFKEDGIGMDIKDCPAKRCITETKKCNSLVTGCYIIYI